MLPYQVEFLSRLNASTQRTYGPHLEFFSLFLRRNGCTLESLTKRAVDLLIREIDKLNITAATKRKYLQTISSYLNFLFENELIPERIRVPRPSQTHFLDVRSNQLIKQDALRPPTIGEMRKILQYARSSRLRNYIALSILFINGMRASELLSIRLSNIIHLEGQINDKGRLVNVSTYLIKTGIEEGARKTGTSYYFIPPNFYNSAEFQQYLSHREKLIDFYGDRSDYLFYSPTSQSGYLSTKTLRQYMQKIKKKLPELNPVRLNLHIFRDVINEMRMERGCPQTIMEILLNHSPTGTNARYYLKKLKNPLWRYYYFAKYTPVNEILLI